MKFTNEKLSLENGLNKEWIITNGLGGYSSSTILGINTRKYHGLFVASLMPPGRRFLILSKLDESIEIDNKKYDLYTNICEEYIGKGYKYQEEFRKEFVPIFKYKVEGVEITKIICMEYGKNTLGVYYKIRNCNKKSKLSLAPIMNFRDFHCVNTNLNFELKQDINKGKVKLTIDGNSQTPIYMNIKNSNYVQHNNDIFYNMFYIEEEKRGFYPKENHVVTGVYEIEIEPNEEKEISFICSLEENIENIDVKDLIDKEIIRLNEIFNKSLLIDLKNRNKSKEESENEELIKTFLAATDNFIVYRPSFGLHTLIAGYHWFLDWGRDTLISYEGLTLVPKRFGIAREILLTLTRDIKNGLVPNGYSGFDSRPLYNSVDASLLLFEQVKKYIEYTQDYEFIKNNIYEKLIEIIDNYVKGIDIDDNNIYLDTDGLMVSGTPDTQNTWMDAKYDGIAITPRNGKVVEINSMWYNSNKIMSELVSKFENRENAKKYEKIAQKCKSSFEEKFYNSKKKCLYDVLGDNKIRPNQLFALSLTYPIIEPKSEIAKNMLETVEKKLLNNYGIKTLAKGEEGYIEVYEGDGQKRDSSYHQGTTWPWLLGLYYNSLKNILKATKTKKEKQILEEKIYNFENNIKNTFKNEIYENGCIGSIAEIYDSKKPHLPKGSVAQGWSVSEVFRIILNK